MTVERVNYGKLNGTAVSFKVFSINLPNKIVERGRNFDKLKLRRVAWKIMAAINETKNSAVTNINQSVRLPLKFIVFVARIYGENVRKRSRSL